MEKARSGGGGAKPATRFGFGFSWADEVEREEREHQQQEQVEQIAAQREAVKREQTRAVDPFGAARPREVVLAEKGVDWRARDSELFDAPAPRRGRHAAAAAVPPRAVTAKGGPGRASNITPVPACARATPARHAPWDRSAGRHAADSTPQTVDAAPVSRGAWGGGKRKCAGERPAPARPVRPVGDHGRGRRVFGELNGGDGCGSSVQTSAKNSGSSGGSATDGCKADEAGVADYGSRGSREPAPSATEDESAVGRKRGRGRRGPKKTTENPRTLIL